MNQHTQREDHFEKPEWETPELVVEMVAAITESNASSAMSDGGTGS